MHDLKKMLAGRNRRALGFSAIGLAGLATPLRRHRLILACPASTIVTGTRRGHGGAGACARRGGMRGGGGGGDWRGGGGGWQGGRGWAIMAGWRRLG